MTTTPICHPHQLRRDWLGRALAATAIALALALLAAGAADRSGPAPTGPVRLDDAGAVAPAVSRPEGDDTRPPAIEAPSTDWRDIPLFSADDPAAPPIDKTSDRVLRISSVGELTTLFDTLGYDHVRVGDLGISVPRLYLTALPADIAAGEHAGARPGLFISALLPVLLRVNEAIAADRALVLRAAESLAAHGTLDAPARDAIERLAAAYRLDPAAPAAELVAALERRVDAVPPSMGLAQAAVESGWGTSSLARNGNALFGQTGSRGVRSSTGHVYATFEDLMAAVEAYARNLNTHPAYEPFRTLRAEQRAAGEALDGVALMGGLSAYSELGAEYIRYVRRLMRGFDLPRLDGARLADPSDPADRTPASI